VLANTAKAGLIDDTIYGCTSPMPWARVRAWARC